MPEEIIDICDEENNLLNIQKSKNEAHKDGLWHRAAQIWIYNSKQEILLQLRSKDKAIYPNRWDTSVAGHVSANEEPITSAMREIEEEIGLTVVLKDLRFFKIIKINGVYQDLKFNEFYYVYFLKFDDDLNTLNIQKEELQAIQFMPINVIENELETHKEKYVPHGNYWFDVINEVKKLT